MKPKTAGRSGGESHFANPLFSESTGTHGLEIRATTGFVRDAQIITMRGMQPVQGLRVGDRVISRGGGAVSVERIEQRSLVTRAIYIFAGSLGHSRADRDTLLPADQTVLLRDWRAHVFSGRPEILIPASALVDGEFVRDLGQQPMTLYRVFCAHPHVLYADGMELGTADALTYPINRNLPC